MSPAQAEGSFPPSLSDFLFIANSSFRKATPGLSSHCSFSLARPQDICKAWLRTQLQPWDTHTPLHRAVGNLDCSKIRAGGRVINSRSQGMQEFGRQGTPKMKKCPGPCWSIPQEIPELSHVLMDFSSSQGPSVPSTTTCATAQTTHLCNVIKIIKRVLTQ